MQNILATIKANDPIAAGIHRLVLSVPKALFESNQSAEKTSNPSSSRPLQPGMFVHVAVTDAPDRLLRRPIGLMDADEKYQTVTLAIQSKGPGTCKICAAPPGSLLDILAPIGNGFDTTNAKTVWLVGGGVGAAPLLFAAKKYAPHHSLHAFLGFRSADLVFAFSDISRLCPAMLCTDDGSIGFHGTVVEAMQTEIAKDTPLPDLILACGPTPMLKGVQNFCVTHSVKGQLSLEQRMGCGYGACLTCACKISGEAGVSFARVCVDGPVFDAERVVL
jgi:dihydroorotate dehydrogenase electron transfer subunit